MFVSMKNKIRFVLVLMCSCVLGITGLQLYWNFQNYKAIVENFKKDTNSALAHAVDDELAVRRQKLIVKIKHWMADTSLIRITCNINNRDSMTIFYLQDVHPRFKEDEKRKEPFEIGINDFNQKLREITPAAKQFFINHFVNGKIRTHLENGSVYWYTQTLGDSIEKSYNESRLNKAVLAATYTAQLRKKEIYGRFKLNPTAKINTQFLTQKVNASMRRPYRQEMVWASHESPTTYYLREMKWLMISSLLLIGITIYCFSYTAKTLLNQHQLNALKDDFIDNMTHEIKTPLTSMAITAEALQTFDKDEVKRKDYLKIITYQIGKLDELTDHLLSAAKPIKKGNKDLTSVNINEVINEAVVNLDVQLKAANASVKLDLYPDLMIKGHQFDLIHAVMNMIDNSIKYASATPVIEIEAKKVKNVVVITMSDNGIGISVSHQKQIFDKFFRVPTGNVHNIKGSGLGLSYVQAVMKAHQGKVKMVESNSAGTTFILTFPHLS
jgi:two-component system phosphate regulon sensor histidine kinase PhoR